MRSISFCTIELVALRIRLFAFPPLCPSSPDFCANRLRCFRPARPLPPLFKVSFSFPFDSLSEEEEEEGDLEVDDEAEEEELDDAELLRRRD